MAFNWLCSIPHVQCCASDMAIFGFLSGVKRKKRNVLHTRLAEQSSALPPHSLQPLPARPLWGKEADPCAFYLPCPHLSPCASRQSVGLTHLLASLYRAGKMWR